MTILVVLSTPTRSAIHTTFHLEADRRAMDRPRIGSRRLQPAIAMGRGTHRAQASIDPIPRRRVTDRRMPVTLRPGPHRHRDSISRKGRHLDRANAARTIPRIATGLRIRATVQLEMVPEMGPGTHLMAANTSLLALRLAVASRTRPTLRAAPGTRIRATRLLAIGPGARLGQTRTIAAISSDDSRLFSADSSVHFTISFFEDSCIIPGT
jgi:hypothetical protein